MSSLFCRILLHVGIDVSLVFGRWRFAGKNVVDPCPDLRYEGAETLAMKRVPRVRDLDATFCEDLIEGRFCGLFEFGGLCLVTFQCVSLRLGRLEPAGLYFEKDLLTGQGADRAADVRLRRAHAILFFRY